MCHALVPMTLLPPRVDGAVTLPTRRRLGYAEFGAPDGFPVLWLHGTPGARTQVPPLARSAALERGLRVIGVERPGIGRSTQHRYRTLSEFAPDIETLADRLGLGRFGVVGLSGGGPYTLAIAHHLPDRVPAVGVLGGVAPSVGPRKSATGVVQLARTFNVPLAAATPVLGRAMWGFVNGLKPFARQIYAGAVAVMPEGDKVVFASDGVEEMFVGDLLRGSRRQCTAVFNDAVLFGRDWGFDPTEIGVPVHWWHGDADPIVPLADAQALTAHMPTAELRVRPGESHLGGFGIAAEVLEAVAADV